MTERSVAIRGLRHARTDGIPPPSTVIAGNEGVESTASIGQGPTPSEMPGQPTQGTEVGRTHASTHDSTPIFDLDNLLRDPVAACRAMSRYREDMPVRALNVDLTPGIARRFDDQCRVLRVKKKDVVELLLRGWLTHLGHQDLDAAEGGPTP